jgi:hypothetical protein
VREVRALFPHVRVGSGAAAAGYLAASLAPTLHTALAALCKARPGGDHDAAATAQWLGDWLLAHNPHAAAARDAAAAAASVPTRDACPPRPPPTAKEG